jgi:putative membrane protein
MMPGAEWVPFAIIAALAAHTVFEFVPAIFLFVPEEGTVVATLPGQRMMLAGKGIEALQITAISCLGAAGIAFVLLPFAGAFFPLAYGSVKGLMLPVLVAACAFLLWSEREGRKIAIATGVFLLSGMLGFATLRLGISDPLFATFSGLFAVSGLLMAGEGREERTRQKECGRLKLDFAKYVFIGAILGLLADLLPGIASPAQIAVFATALVPVLGSREFLALVSSIASSHSVFALSAAASIGKARVGAVAIAEQYAKIDSGLVWVYGALFVLVVGVCAAVVIRFSGKIANVVSGSGIGRLNYPIIAYLAVAVLLICGPSGLAVMGTGAAIGCLPVLLGVRRTHVMGAILVPSMVLIVGFG